MTDPNLATPRSASVSEPLLKAPKDKNCPFCGQAFTSSSLGRHLDLYIRQKNPKPPDGVHVVDEIKKIRGNITRRQAKGSIKRELSTPTTDKKHSVTGDESPILVASPLDDDDTVDDSLVSAKPRQRFNDISWQDKPNGQPPRALGVKTPEVRRDVSRQMQKAELDQRHKLSDDVDTAKATEMALKELLKSVREANAKATSPALFDFDPYTLNFPSLCLHILPAPSTLFSPTPFPTSESWSITPPGQRQFQALNRQVQERLLAYQRQRQINQLYPASHSSSSSADNSPLPTPPLFDPDPQKLFSHITDAYNHWSAHTDRQRQEAWQLEVLRSYARANDLRREAAISLENARREIDFLKANRWSSGHSEVSPITFSIGNETVKELGKLGMDFRNWDYDRLIDKWRSIVRSNKSASSGMAAQKPLPNSDTRSCSMASLPTQFTKLNGAEPDVKLPPNPYSSAPPTTNGTEPGSDQLDAEGEDDDAEADLDAEAASDEGSMSNQQHNIPLQPTPHHPSQVAAHTLAQASVNYQAQAHAQAHAQAQAQAAQAQAQAQAWAAARQHMNQSRNQHHHAHQHQQLSPHPQHMGSGANSRRSSHAFIDTQTMHTGGMLPMEGIENHQDQFLRMDMGLASTFVGATGDGV
jgi:hypothetical protein